MSDAPAPLSVGAVAARLGLAPATLRTWDRRYGLGPSHHPAGAHRRYDADDLARLLAMKRLVQEGVAPADAARAVLSGEVQVEAPKGSGGRVLALPHADRAVKGLARAAMALDARAVTDTVAEHLGRHGVVATWEGLLMPVLVSVGERWESTGEGVEVEHLVSDCVATALRGHATAPEPPRPLLLAGAPDDQHVLPQHALAAALAERGIGARVLGPSVPHEALTAAVRRTSPAAVFVWSQTARTGHPQTLELPATRPAPAVVAGGPGWRAVPQGVARADSLGAAVRLMERALSGEALASSG